MRTYQSNTILFNYGCKLLLVLIFLLAIIQKSYSQSPGKNETLTFLNKKLGGKTVLDIRMNNLVVSIKDDKGNLIREDKVTFSELDLKSFYEEESDLLCVPCLKDAPGCVTRTLIVQKIKRPCERISISVGGKENYKIIQKALEHLIKLESEVGYKDEITLE